MRMGAASVDRKTSYVSNNCRFAHSQPVIRKKTKLNDVTLKRVVAAPKSQKRSVPMKKTTVNQAERPSKEGTCVADTIWYTKAAPSMIIVNESVVQLP